GVQNIYGVPGDAILPFLDAVAKNPQLNFISVKHEGAAALMASAEAKLMDRLGVCIGTSGPGVANLINGLADAKSDQVPVLVITGQVDSYNIDTEYKQVIDQSLLLAAVTDYSGLVVAPDACNDIMVKALRTALVEGTVTHIGFVKDVWSLATEEAVRAPEPYLKTVVQSRPEVIQEAVRRLNEAQRPAILVGRGIRNLGTEVIRLAEKWQCGICMTMPAKGLLQGNHLLVLGGLGEGGSEAATAMLAEADLILILGATWWPEKYVPDSGRIIQVDAIPVNIGKRMPVEYGVVGPMADVLPQIIAGIIRQPKDMWVKRLSVLRDGWLGRIAPETRAEGQPLSPGYLIKTLEERAAEDAVMALDVGDHAVWFNRIFAGSRQDVLVSGSWRTMGFGLPAALSAKLAQPERQVVALVGDGCLAQSLGEFITAIRYQLPVTVVVVNNGYLAMEKDKMEVNHWDTAVTAISNPDFARFAESCGGVGYRVERAEDLSEALNQAFSSNRPAIVDVITSAPLFPAMIQ
ncbi:MAG TPA: thiamine pyrophosphate-binding protein, partial [Bacillota bacterium]|nr:thiamine pyrophosphate-binding protein [Bacillota bacterium]